MKDACLCSRIRYNESCRNIVGYERVELQLRLLGKAEEGDEQGKQREGAESKYLSASDVCHPSILAWGVVAHCMSMRRPRPCFRTCISRTGQRRI
ncbi:hypothetical protein COCVIDRAFT_111079 [Bipolaris victoriae FI3]|uniref:Uncharacterized protein n=1 Tax=Bipolaris victoriae (strain FI3) TaxID=930091 RepID=W7E2S9_BIPV3|nr:hypothetical protein COCVIDRAFT_111079 [Bipolaris victoriae FI3]